MDTTRSLCSVTRADPGCLVHSEPCSHSTDMNPGNFSTIQKQLLFSKNLRHASLGELHTVPPTMALTVCGNLILGLQAWGKPTWLLSSEGETAVITLVTLLFQKCPRSFYAQEYYPSTIPNLCSCKTFF